jgi:hypothetical protein
LRLRSGQIAAQRSNFSIAIERDVPSSLFIEAGMSIQTALDCIITFSMITAQQFQKLVLRLFRSLVHSHLQSSAISRTLGDVGSLARTARSGPPADIMFFIHDPSIHLFPALECENLYRGYNEPA